MGKNGIPDRWLDYSNYGDVIEGTRIVALKVPLKQVLLSRVDAKERFSPQMAASDIPGLDFIIDLTYTKRYYSPVEFQSRGVGHSKIATEGHVIPNGAVMRRFFDTMDAYLADVNRSGVIGVHCTHGVNRTGYMVCRYMIAKLGFEPDQAIAAFNKARGHDLERANYLADLRAATWPDLPDAVEEPEEPPEEDARRDQWGPADQRRQRRDERRRGPYGPRWHGPGPGFWRPPPPWAGPDWRPWGPPPPHMPLRPPWMRPGGWRHGPPPRNGYGPPHDGYGPPWARDGPPPRDGDDAPPPTGDSSPRRDDAARTDTRVLEVTTERCAAAAVETEAETVIVLSDGETSVPPAVKARTGSTGACDDPVVVTDVTSSSADDSVDVKRTAPPASATAERPPGAARLSPGAAQLSPGAKRLSPGVAQLSSGEKRLSPGAKRHSPGSSQLSPGAKRSRLSPGKAGDRPSSRGAGERPSSRGAGERPSSRGTGDRPSSRGAGERPSSRGSGDRPAPSSRGAGDRPSSRGAGDKPSSRGAGDRPSPRGSGGAPAKEREEAANDAPVRRGFRERAADAGWSWGGRR